MKLSFRGNQDIFCKANHRVFAPMGSGESTTIKVVDLTRILYKHKFEDYLTTQSLIQFSTSLRGISASKVSLHSLSAGIGNSLLSKASSVFSESSPTCFLLTFLRSNALMSSNIQVDNTSCSHCETTWTDIDIRSALFFIQVLVKKRSRVVLVSCRPFMACFHFYSYILSKNN